MYCCFFKQCRMEIHIVSVQYLKVFLSYVCRLFFLIQKGDDSAVNWSVYKAKVTKVNGKIIEAQVF